MSDLAVTAAAVAVGPTLPGAEALLVALAVAIPLWQREVRKRPVGERMERAHALAHVIAAHGDNILYRGPKKGDTAEAFNALAEGLALASMVPGGVTFCGRHWETSDGR